MGAQTYSLLSGLLTPDKPGDQTYKLTILYHGGVEEASQAATITKFEVIHIDRGTTLLSARSLCTILDERKNGTRAGAFGEAR